MALELVYTSAARGLRPGGGGFCTVAMTVGMPASLVPRLEALSGYRPAPSGANPVAHCFWRVETAAGIMPVLAIVSAAPPDHTARSNKIAAFLVLSPDEMPPAGPAWMVARQGLIRRSWSGDPRWIETPVAVPKDGDASMRRCTAWERAAGDAGWAGVVASTFLRDQSWPIHVVYGAETDPLPLVDEAIRLMPAWARWRATFSTYFLQTVAGIPCALRFCLDGTSGADIARNSKGLLIDLTQPLERAPDSRFCRMARTGVEEPDPAAQPSGGIAPISRSEDELGLEELAEPSPRARMASRREGRAAGSSRPGKGHVASGRGRNNPLLLAMAMGAVTLLVVLLVAVAVIVLKGGGSANQSSGPYAEPPALDPSAIDRPTKTVEVEPEPEPAPIPDARADPAPPTPAPPTPVPPTPAAKPSAPAEPAPSRPESKVASPVPSQSQPAATPPQPSPEQGTFDPGVFAQAVDDRAFLVDRPVRIVECPLPIESAKIEVGKIPGIQLRERPSAIEFASVPVDDDPTVLGQLEWRGGDLSWKWRRVGTRANRSALDSLGRALAFSEIEVLLQGGSRMLLQPPAPSFTTRVVRGDFRSVDVPVPPWEAPKVAIGLNADWRKSEAPAGSVACRSAAGIIIASWDQANGACVIRWSCEELDRLQQVRRQLADRRDEIRTRVGKEREVIEGEIAGLVRQQEELEQLAASLPPTVPPLAPIEVRGRTGRVLGRINVTLDARSKQ